MKKYLKFILVLIMSISIMSAGFVAVNTVFAQGAPDIGIPNPGLPQRDVRAVVSDIIRVLLTMLGTICLVIVLYAGFLWMTAAGDEAKIDKAKATLKAAIIGLALILMSYALTKFVFDQLLSATRGGSGTGGGL